MKELREERSVSIENRNLLFLMNKTMPQNRQGLNLCKVKKVVELPTKALLKNVKIIKKDGTKEEYDVQKVISAVKKSAARMLVEFTKEELENIVNYVDSSVLKMHENEIEIFKMHCIVENALEVLNPKVAKSYRNYRNYKIDFVDMLDKVYQESQKIMYIGDKENSNADSALVFHKTFF